MAEYDPGYTPPDWWHAEAKRIIERDWHGKRAELAVKASAAAGRSKPWDSTRITKYLSQDNMTLRLTMGLAEAIGIPSPVIEARSMEEAGALKQRAKSFDPVEKTIPDKDAKITTVLHGLDSLVEAKKDQTKPVRSSDERSPRGPGHRRASTRR